MKVAVAKRNAKTSFTLVKMITAPTITTSLSGTML